MRKFIQKIFAVILLLLVIPAMGCTAKKQTKENDILEKNEFTESDGIFHYKMKEMDVYMLIESQRDGNTSILVGANEELFKKYIPETGFKHSTNAILVKKGGKNILFDTAFGGAIYSNIKKLNVELNDITDVFITHLHGDHIGGLQKDGKILLPNAKIYLSAKEYNHFVNVQPNKDAIAALQLYGDKVITFEPVELGRAIREIIEGVYPFSSYGHTPGHTGFVIEKGGEKFIVAGDFLHIALVQFPNPNISATYDSDKEMAALSRRQILEYAAQNKIPVGGMHIVYPGAGFVEKDEAGYKFIPLK